MPPYSFTITGRPAVKKNNQKVVTTYSRRFGRNITHKIDTGAYKVWHASALQQFAEIVKPEEPIWYTSNLRCYFFMPTIGTVDLSALYEGIQDVMKEVGIIVDDNYRIIAGHDGSRVFYDPDNPRMEICIKKMADGYDFHRFHEYRGNRKGAKVKRDEQAF